MKSCCIIHPAPGASLCETHLAERIAAREARRDARDRATFDEILHLEQAVRVSGVTMQFRTAGTSDFRSAQQETGHAADKARLFAAIDALTPAQAKAYGQYRANA